MEIFHGQWNFEMYGAFLVILMAEGCRGLMTVKNEKDLPVKGKSNAMTKSWSTVNATCTVSEELPALNDVEKPENVLKL
jgi:hypothetical protein